jgi:tetratricopeptide (TPR) repeat protein
VTTGRNEPCPCGSGTKFKHCCGCVDAAPPSAVSIQSLIELINTGRAADAEQQVTGLLRARPSAGVLWKILSVAQLRQNKEAMAALRRTAELLPDDAEAHANLGSELAARRQWDAALQSLRRALAINPSKPDVLVDAADAQLALGRYAQAVEIYQQALQIEPHRADAHNNLGNALLGLGDAAAAASSYKTALALRPQDAQILCNLGNALRQIGELEHAEKCTRLALGIAPGLSMAHNNLGLLLAARGERDAAIASYREALRYNPGYIEAHRNLGQAWLESRRTRQAVDSFRQAIQLQPAHAGAHLGLAAALRIQRRPAEAEASCRQALEIAPESADGLVLLGELNADGGRFAEAQALFARALRQDPGFTPAYCSIAAHRRMTAADDGWLRSVQSLLERSLPAAHQMQLRYVLGKYFDDTGSYDEAFSNYQRANELNKALGSRYEAARLTSLVDGLIGERNHLGVQSNDSQQPIFIIGMPRSGTSLAEQILSSHASVFGAGEVAFWDRADPRNEQLASQYLERIGESANGAPRITDKMPANFLYLGLIHAVFPHARIIHMRRHPLDTCLSVYFQNCFNVSPYANDLNNLAHYYGQYLRIMQHWRAALPGDALLEVSYEDLVQDTQTWARRMVDFVGLPWDPSCLEFHRTERAVITASKWQVRQKINTGSVGRWRKYARYLAPLQPLAPQERLN